MISGYINASVRAAAIDGGIEPMEADEQALADFLDSLDELIIVEGINDEKALLRHGVDPDLIVVLNKGQTLEQTVEAISVVDRAIILTDMDRAGKELRHKLIRLFGLYGIREHKKPRELFARLHLSHVEGL